MVYRVAKSQTRLKQLGTHTYRKLQDILSPKKKAAFPLSATWNGCPIPSLTPHTGLKGHLASRSELPSSPPQALGQARCASLF